MNTDTEENLHVAYRFYRTNGLTLSATIIAFGAALLGWAIKNPAGEDIYILHPILNVYFASLILTIGAVIAAFFIQVFQYHGYKNQARIQFESSRPQTDESIKQQKKLEKKFQRCFKYQDGTVWVAMILIGFSFIVSAIIWWPSTSNTTSNQTSNTSTKHGATMDEACNILAKKYIDRFQNEYQKDYTLIETESFYSKKEDSCILIEKALVGVDVDIRDLTKSIILDGTEDFNMLLNCDTYGADSIVLDKVRVLNGQVYDVPYTEWLDDGFGGLPRTLKKPDKPYTKKDCDLVLQKWLSILK